MKLAGWKQVVLGAVVALSVAGSALAPVVAGHAAAAERDLGDMICVRVNGGWYCWQK